MATVFPLIHSVFSKIRLLTRQTEDRFDAARGQSGAHRAIQYALDHRPIDGAQDHLGAFDAHRAHHVETGGVALGVEGDMAFGLEPGHLNQFVAVDRRELHVAQDRLLLGEHDGHLAVRDLERFAEGFDRLA